MRDDWIKRIVAAANNSFLCASHADGTRYITTVPGGNLFSGMCHFCSCRQSTTTWLGGPGSTGRLATLSPCRIRNASFAACRADASTWNRLPPTMRHPMTVSKIAYTGALEEATTVGHTFAVR